MARPELGTKRQCQNCGAKFYDLLRSPIVCPKCATVFQAAQPKDNRSGPAQTEDETEVKAPQEAELVPLEAADAETAKGERANPTAAMASQVSVLLQQADDPAKALPIAERLAKQAKPDDLSAFYLLGETQRKLGDCKSAIVQFEKVLTKRPEAQNSRYGAASCYEKLGDGGKAANNYEEFARRFPKDDRASEATAAAKRLRKAG